MEQTVNQIEATDADLGQPVAWRPLGSLAASLVAAAARRRDGTEDAAAAYEPSYAWAAE